MRDWLLRQGSVDSLSEIHMKRTGEGGGVARPQALSFGTRKIQGVTCALSFRRKEAPQRLGSGEPFHWSSKRVMRKSSSKSMMTIEGIV